MVKKYLTSTVRYLLKTKIFTVINILGLALGIAACILILHYVTFQKSYDQFHPDSEHIYRIRYERSTGEGNYVRFASCCPPASNLIKEKIPEVEKIGRIFRYRTSVSHNDVKFFEDRLYFAEPDFFSVLKFNFLVGDPGSSFAEPNRAFISQSTAKKYFGEENPIGQILSVDKKEDYEVVGIFEDVPANSHLKFDILLPYKNFLKLYGEDIEQAWGHSGFFTYAKIRSDVTQAGFEKKLADLIESEIGEDLRKYKWMIYLIPQPLHDIHLNSHYMQEYEINGNRNTVEFLFLIAIFIIVMAWVNYINLTTARSLHRAREVGLRKVVGANRFQIMIQFFLEVGVINIFAFIFSGFLCELVFPIFRDITGMPSAYSLWDKSWQWFVLGGMYIGGVLLSGIYPVLVMSSFRPITVLRGKLGTHGKGAHLRKSLVVFQFAMALALIMMTMTVFNQLNFMRQQDLGFEVQQKVVMKAPRVRGEQFESNYNAFRETLLANPGFEKFCFASEFPGRQILWDAGAIRRAGTDPLENKNYQIVGIDYDFAEMFNLKFAAGRNFSKEFGTDKEGLIINETAAEWLGFESAESAVGQKIDYWGNIYTVVGVLQNFHQQSPKENFEPHIYRLLPHGRDVRGHFAAQLSAGAVSEKIAFLKSQYEKFFPGNPFDFYFLDEYFNQQYRADELLGRVFTLFSLLAMVITALGIFGLSVFAAMQRTKEMGIRKVLGADLGQIIVLLVKDILILLLISFFLITPLMFFGIEEWLKNFAKQSPVNPELFIIPLIIVGSITLITVAYQTIKSAMENPVKIIRYE